MLDDELALGQLAVGPRVTRQLWACRVIERLVAGFEALRQWRGGAELRRGSVDQPVAYLLGIKNLNPLMATL